MGAIERCALRQRQKFTITSLKTVTCNSFKTLESGQELASLFANNFATYEGAGAEVKAPAKCVAGLDKKTIRQSVELANPTNPIFEEFQHE